MSGRSSVVEHHLAKVRVEGSNLFARSRFFKLFQKLNPFHLRWKLRPFRYLSNLDQLFGQRASGLNKFRLSQSDAVAADESEKPDVSAELSPRAKLKRLENCFM